MSRYTIVLCFILYAVGVSGQQLTDSSFTYTPNPKMYPKSNGPLILIDEAHFNFHTMNGRYQPFACLLQNDGYTIKPGTEKYTSQNLKQVRILVIANALSDDTSEWKLPAKQAFDRSETAAINNWVQQGGNLFLIADHMPFAGAASGLAASFGFNFINGFAVRKDDKNEIFSRRTHNLFSTTLTAGRNKKEKIDSVIIFTGQGFLPPPGAITVLSLKNDYLIYLPTDASDIGRTTPVIDGSGLSVAAYLNYGKGRIMVAGEAAMFSAQLAGPEKIKIGMNHIAAVQNPRFLLNIIHWLDRTF